MKNRSSLLWVTMMLIACVATAQEPKKILFVGNSYTGVNDLPKMVADISELMGEKVVYHSNTPGGCTFKQHCTNQSMNMIRAGGWDAVVLQEQSQYPSFPDMQVQDEVFPYAKTLVDSIYANSPCAEPIFYMTWGHKYGDSYNAQFFPPLATYEGMDSLLALRYTQMAADNDASLCPVGRVWRYLRTNKPQIELYQSDNSHPTQAGTYAAACAFYTILFQRDPDSISFNSQLQPNVAADIRQAVHLVVYDSLTKWKRKETGFQAVLTQATDNGNTAMLQLDTVVATNVVCQWGDGQADTLGIATLGQSYNLQHTYADSGIYSIVVTANRHCTNQEEQLTFHATQQPGNPSDTTGVAMADMVSVRLAPNPANEWLRVELPWDETQLVLFGADGRKVLETNVLEHTATISLRNVPNGVYTLHASDLRGGQQGATRLLVLH